MRGTSAGLAGRMVIANQPRIAQMTRIENHKRLFFSSVRIRKIGGYALWLSEQLSVGPANVVRFQHFRRDGISVSDFAQSDARNLIRLRTLHLLHLHVEPRTLSDRELWADQL